MPLADFIAISLRASSFVAVVQAAGIPVFVWLFADRLPLSRGRVERLARRTAASGLVLAVAYQLVEPARLTGALRDVLDTQLQALLLATDAGTATAARVLGLGLVAVGTLKPSRVGLLAALAGAALIVASFAFIGHTATADLRGLLSSLLIVHLSVVAFWFGALWPLRLAGRHEEPATFGSIVERFSAFAVWLVPVIAVAGLGLAIGLLPSFQALRSPYGLLLLLKIALFAVLMGLASLNKWRFGPAIRVGQANAIDSLSRTVLVEWVLVASALAVTATMTGLFSPANP